MNNDQKRTVLAFVLTGVIVFTWQALFSSNQPVQQPVKQEQVQTQNTQGTATTSSSETKPIATQTNKATNLTSVTLKAGSFLYTVSTDENNSNLRVDGDNIFSQKVIQPGKSIEIPIYFQFRMTDYYGNTDNVGNAGYTLLGFIGGVKGFRNISYTKTLGFDFYTKYGTQQGFDLKFTAKYTSTGTTITNFLGKHIIDPIYTI